MAHVKTTAETSRLARTTQLFAASAVFMVLVLTIVVSSNLAESAEKARILAQESIYRAGKADNRRMELDVKVHAKIQALKGLSEELDTKREQLATAEKATREFKEVSDLLISSMEDVKLMPTCMADLDTLGISDKLWALEYVSAYKTETRRIPGEELRALLYAVRYETKNPTSCAEIVAAVDRLSPVVSSDIQQRFRDLAAACERVPMRTVLLQMRKELVKTIDEVDFRGLDSRLQEARAIAANLIWVNSYHDSKKWAEILFWSDVEIGALRASLLRATPDTDADVRSAARRSAVKACMVAEDCKAPKDSLICTNMYCRCKSFYAIAAWERDGSLKSTYYRSQADLFCNKQP